MDLHVHESLQFFWTEVLLDIDNVALFRVIRNIYYKYREDLLNTFLSTNYQLIISAHLLKTFKNFLHAMVEETVSSYTAVNLCVAL